MLMEAAPQFYFETDHYKGWPVVLVRIQDIPHDELALRLRRAWLTQAPKTLAKAFERGVEGSSPAYSQSQPRRLK